MSLKDTTCPDGPFEVEVKFHITDGKWADPTIGFVTYTLPRGQYPDAAAIKAAMAESAAALPEGFRFMDRHEFIIEMLGVGRVAVPGPKDFPK